MKTTHNFEKLLEFSLAAFCYKAQKIIVHDVRMKQHETILSLEVHYKDKDKTKIKFKNLKI